MTTLEKKLFDLLSKHELTLGRMLRAQNEEQADILNDKLMEIEIEMEDIEVEMARRDIKKVINRGA